MTNNLNVQVLRVPSESLGDQFFAAPATMRDAKADLEEIVKTFNMDDGYAGNQPNLVSVFDFAAAYSFMKVDAMFAGRFPSIQTCAVSL